MGDFLESVLTADRLAEFERHLEGCDPCQAYLNTYRKTRHLTTQSERVEMPAEMRSRLRDFLLRQLSANPGREL